jgi:hypothetical protein
VVHEKFIYRNGKKYGPYLYENKRMGDKVITSYVGRTTPSLDRPGHHMPLAFGGVLFLFLLLASFERYPTTGFATFKVTSLVEGAPLEGRLSFSLVSSPSDQTYVTLIRGNASVTLPWNEVVQAPSSVRSGTFQYRLLRDASDLSITIGVR